MSFELVMPFNHLILLSPLSLSSFNLSQHQGLIQWVSSLHPKDWSFSFSISPSNEYSGLISFGIDWFDLLAVIFFRGYQIISKLCFWNKPSSFKCLITGEISQSISPIQNTWLMLLRHEHYKLSRFIHACQAPGNMNIFIFFGTSPWGPT